MKKIITLTIVVSVLLIGMPSISVAGTHTVSPGDDIQAVIDAASPGDTIVFDLGTYPLSNTLNVNKPLTLTAADPYAAPKPVIDGGGALSTIIAIAANDVTIEGLEIANGTGDLVYQDLSYSGTTVRNCVVRNSSGDEGIQLKGCTDCLVECNLVYDIAQDGISVASGSFNSVIRNNEIYNVGSENAAIYVYDSYDMTVACNYIHDTPAANGIKMYKNYGGTHTIANNLIVHNTWQGGKRCYDEADGSTINIYKPRVASTYVVRHNTLSDNTGVDACGNPTGHAIYMNDYDGSGFVTNVDDNIATNHNGYGIRALFGASVNYSYNDLWQNALGATDGTPVDGGGNISADPLYSADYTLQAGSPCISTASDSKDMGRVFSECGCAPLDDTGPETTDVVATPNPAAVNSSVTLTANVDDTDTGGSDIASAEYSLDGGITWSPMTAQDGTFDEVSEDVTVTFDAPATAGIYDLCVRGTDVYDNTGPQECILFVVYDPEGGFVTGGGWIDSPPGAYMPSSGSTVVVTPDDVGVSWFPNDTRHDGYVAFVEGPGTPPLGVGSLEMGTTAGIDKAQLFNYNHMDTSLADIDTLTYATYRHSSSTNPPGQYPAINIEVDYVGDDSSYTTLVWEPIYAYGQDNLAVDKWQTWDTLAPSQTSFLGGWWSTTTIPGVLCNPNNPTGCSGEPFYVSWEYIRTNLPNAKIKYGFGVNVGSGWNGVFTGAVDALAIGVPDDSVTYDFEPVAPFDPVGKATFGFVSKYKKGAETPEGNTEFVFHAADLNFHSTSYDWLVVTGSDYAKFKGSGTINGEGDYKFQLWAGDGTDADGADTFRIKIWEEDDAGNENVVYDNGSDQAIGGGSIVVHTKKK